MGKSTKLNAVGGGGRRNSGDISLTHRKHIYVETKQRINFLGKKNGNIRPSSETQFRKKICNNCCVCVEIRY